MSYRSGKQVTRVRVLMRQTLGVIGSRCRWAHGIRLSSDSVCAESSTRSLNKPVGLSAVIFSSFGCFDPRFALASSRLVIFLQVQVVDQKRPDLQVFAVLCRNCTFQYIAECNSLWEICMYAYCGLRTVIVV